MGQFYHKPVCDDDGAITKHVIMYRGRKKDVLIEEVDVISSSEEYVRKQIEVVALNGVAHKVESANLGIGKIFGLFRLIMSPKKLLAKAYVLGEPILNEQNKEKDTGFNEAADIRKQAKKSPKTKIYDPATDTYTSIRDVMQKTHDLLDGLENTIETSGTATPATIIIEADQPAPLAEIVESGPNTVTYVQPIEESEEKKSPTTDEMPAARIAEKMARWKEADNKAKQDEVKTFDLTQLNKGGSERREATRNLFGFDDEEDKENE